MSSLFGLCWTEWRDDAGFPFKEEINGSTNNIIFLLYLAYKSISPFVRCNLLIIVSVSNQSVVSSIVILSVTKDLGVGQSPLTKNPLFLVPCYLVFPPPTTGECVARGGASPLSNYFPLSLDGEGLNTMGSYMCSLVQKSANTNWRGIRSSSHEFRKVAVTHGVAWVTSHSTAIICIELYKVKFVRIVLLLSLTWLPKIGPGILLSRTRHRHALRDIFQWTRNDSCFKNDNANSVLLCEFV
jgi:hypothetical protein